MVHKDELEITVAEVVDHMRLTEKFQPAVQEVIRRKVAARAAKEMGIKVTDQELQNVVDAFRVTKGLNKVSATNRWLRAKGITLEALEEHLEANILISKLKDALEKKAPKSQILASETVRAIVRELVFFNFLEDRM